jgi:hypothetical protein
LIDFHVCQRLPLVHGNKPFLPLTATAEVNDQLCLVSSKSPKYSIQSLLAEMAIREEIGRDDDLTKEHPG